LGAKIAQQRGKRAERTAGYFNNDNALRWEFGIDLKHEVSELGWGSCAHTADALGGLVESALSGELADAWEQVGESD